MSLVYLNVDITEVTKGVVAHGCNCQGVMGGGVALAIRNKWPLAYAEYAKFCADNIRNGNATGDLLGNAQFVPITGYPTLTIANLFTQDRYGTERPHAVLSAVEDSMRRAIAYCEMRRCSLFIPKIGSGLGGLSWDDEVAPMIERLSTLSREQIYVCVV